MPLSPQRWKRVTESVFPWEAEALEFLRSGLPDCDPYFGWTNFSFIADDGTVNEETAKRMGWDRREDWNGTDPNAGPKR